MKTKEELQRMLREAYVKQKGELDDMLAGRLPTYDREMETKIAQQVEQKISGLSRYV